MPTFAERQIFAVVKHAAIARAMVREHPLGRESRMIVAGDLLWSQVFKPGAVPSLPDVAEVHRLGFLERGWTEAT